MRQVAAALQRASELGLVHRDIKPENILVTRKVEVKVTDFGLSRYFGGDGKPVSLTQSGMTLGTPLYMSPEQVQGKVVDHRSDLYSFGVTCYHLLAGSPPYRGSNAFEVAVQHVQSEPEPLEHLRPDLPADLCALVHKLMAKDIESRYQSAKDVLRDLTKIQKGLTLGIANATGTSQPNLGATSQLQSSPLQVSLSGGTLGSVNAVSLPSAPSIPVPTSTEPTRWPWRMLGILGLSAAGIGGWWLFDQLAPVPATKTPVAIVGLPDTRPAHFTTAYESKLKDQFRSKLSPPLQIKVGLELGLHYVYQRRWDEANELFKELEAIRIPKATADVPVPATLIGKFGLAIVLAHQDKVKPALEAFLSAEASLRALRVPAARTEIERFFFTNTEFGLAVAEALNRLAEIEKLPPALEWLRTPNGILRGPR
jgi:serine/threonine-protein kinase